MVAEKTAKNFKSPFFAAREIYCSRILASGKKDHATN